jgi:peptidoglycan/xylan/chitin deacetylase (PgdA/CDA1 family)
MRPFGQHATFYLITERLDRPTVVGQADIETMLADGHEIGSHTVTHANLTILSDENLAIELNKPIADLEARGVTNVVSIAYPFGAVDDRVKNFAREAGYISGRSTYDGSNEKGYTDLHELKRVNVAASTTLASIKSEIDNCLRDKTWLILVFHVVENSTSSYAVSPEMFSDIVTYLDSVDATVVTAKEGAALMSAP